MRAVRLTLALSLALVPVTTSWAAPKTAEIPAILLEIEKKYQAAATLSAEFNQINEQAALGTTKKSAGVIFIKHPDKMRWETRTPDANTLVSNGKTVWFYTPPFDEEDRGQVIEKSAKSIRSKLMDALLAGKFSATRGLQIREKTPQSFVLIPKKGTAGTVKRAEIEVSLERKWIQKVIIEHRDGNRSEIALSNIELGKPLEDSQFNFVAPANTDRVRE